MLRTRADHVWIEGENPASPTPEAQFSGWRTSQYLSRGNWWFANVDSDDLKKVTDEGVEDLEKGKGKVSRPCHNEES